jgi:hypothetical protein
LYKLLNNLRGSPIVDIQDGGNSITVDGAVTVSGTATVSGTVAATQSGTWTVTESSNSADGATTIPSTDLISGWDGINVRSVFVQNLDGHNTVFTHDNLNRRLLEDVLIDFPALTVIGATRKQRSGFLWSEAVLVLGAALALAALLGWLLSEMLVAMLQHVFDPPPDHLAAPWGFLGTLAGAAILGTVVAGAVAVLGLRRLALGAILREE